MATEADILTRRLGKSGLVPIPGFKTVAQVEENAGAMSFSPLPEEQVQQVRAIVAEHEPQAP